MARTLLTISEQNQFLSENPQYRTIKHKWSSRGMGSSKILDAHDNILGAADGCGYDRYGAALGNAIMALFPKLVHKLAKKTCKNGDRKTYMQGPAYYGLFYNKTQGSAWLDGGCGDNCMIAILNKIGFSLERVGESHTSRSGTVFYTLTPINKHEKKWVK